MLLLHRYIFRQLLVSLLVITVSLVSAVWLTQSLRFIDYVVNRGLSLSLFFTLSSLMIPSFLVIVLPIALFVAVLVVYHRLTVESELVVAQGAGCSNLTLAKPALITALLVALLGYSITLYFMPHSYRAFKDLQHDIRSQYSAALLQEGVFTPIGADMTVYVGKRAGDGSLQDILIHDTRQPHRIVTILAKQGAIVNVNQEPRLLVINGSRQEFDEKTGGLNMLYFDRYTLDINNATTALAETRKRTTQEYFLLELLNPSSELPPREHQRLRAAGHSRLVSPLYAFPFTLIAVLTLMGGTFSRRGYGKRLMIGVLCMAGLQGISIGVENIAAQQSTAIPLMYITALLPSITCLYLLVVGSPRLSFLTHRTQGMGSL
jgi:lipopolysaccharide export system permease protein